MNTIKRYSIFCIIALIFSGCEDFLKQTPYGSVTLDNFWQAESDVIYALNALHEYTTQEGTTGRGTMWFENCSDNMITGRGPHAGDAPKHFQMTPATGIDVNHQTNGAWATMYLVIMRANDIIRYVPGMNISESLKNNALGQAYFFRAYAYLWLAPWYADNGPNGGLPVITELTPVEGIDAPRPSSVLENYDMMLADFRRAGELLPLHGDMDPADYGRPHKAAAWAFAARAALYASQYDNKYFDTVIEMCDNVINLTGASRRGLFPDYTRLFRMENNFSEEYIFSMLGNELRGPKFHGMTFHNGGWGMYNTWGFFQPTLELYNAFEPGDVRRDATILYPGQNITFLGEVIQWGVSRDVSSLSGMTFRKFMSIFEAPNALGTVVNTNGNNQSNRLGTVVMRYADVLLMKAEALIWRNGEGNAEARELLNDIRERAGLPRDSEATREQLKNERRVELAFEFKPSRHIDLVRWGDAQEAYAKPLHGLRIDLDEDDEGNKIRELEAMELEVIEVWGPRNFNPQVHHVFPIPATQTSRSQNLTQNIGY